MDLRPARTQEGDRLYGWILEWAAWFARRGIEQWNPPYPKRLFLKELEEGSVQCLGSEDEAVGMVTIFPAPPFYYPEDIWDEEPAWYLSRVVVPKGRSGTGVGATLMQAVEGAALAESKERLRIDVVGANPVLRDIWERFGFEVVKEASIRGVKCAFMEKVLPKPTPNKPHNSGATDNRHLSLGSDHDWHHDGRVTKFVWVGDTDAEIARAYAIAFTSAGSILLVGGVPEDAGWPGLWLPGGGVKEEETPEAALRRELLEEAGATVLALRPLGAQRVEDEVWELQHQIFYWCRVSLDPDFVPRHEVTEYELVSPEQFLDKLFWGRADPKAAMLLELARDIDETFGSVSAV